MPQQHRQSHNATMISRWQNARWQAAARWSRKHCRDDSFAQLRHAAGLIKVVFACSIVAVCVCVAETRFLQQMHSVLSIFGPKSQWIRLLIALKTGPVFSTWGRFTRVFPASSCQRPRLVTGSSSQACFVDLKPCTRSVCVWYLIGMGNPTIVSEILATSGPSTLSELNIMTIVVHNMRDYNIL